MGILNNSNAISVDSGYDITDSLRFRKSAGAYLNRTPSSVGDRKTFTLSSWVKRGQLGVVQGIFDAYADGNHFFQFLFDANNKLSLYSIENPGTYVDYSLLSDAVYRDVSAWYHIVLVINTPDSTQANRGIIYVNGVRQSVTNPSGAFDLNATTQVNTATQHNLGRTTDSSAPTLDGYMTEVNFVDGTALAPTDFGETDDNGTWIPKKYTGTYGTNGFYLNFSNSSSVAALGTDSSGNSNTWTVNNVSLTAGVTYDLMSDVPTLTNTDTSNFATLNPNDSYVSSLTNGNLNFANGSGAAYKGISNFVIDNIANSQKYYLEYVSDTGYINGIATTANSGSASNASYSDIRGYYNNGNKYEGTSATSYGASFTSSDKLAMLIGDGKIEFFKNNASQGVAFSSLTGSWKVLSVAFGSAGSGVSYNFGQQPFNYTPPTGSKKLNTFNLPDSTITNGREQFDTQLWSGNNANPRSFSDTAFSPDFVWYKSRNNAYSHNLYDSVRGATKTLYSNDTSAEYVNDSSGTLKSFDSDGFTVGGDSNVSTVNTAGQTFVGWQWRGSDSTAASNSAGSITSTVSANPTAGFSIATWTNESSGDDTVGHGLGVAPELIITKLRSTSGDWYTHTTAIDGGLDYLKLNSTNAAASLPKPLPTADVFTTDMGGTTTAVAYCFASVEGYSKISRYIGNGSADGPFVYTGFRPAWIMFRSTILCNWVIVDSARSTFNVMDDSLYPNTNGTEITTITDVDFLSNGFKWRANLPNETNASGQTYIYMAFAENPFKNSNAR